MLSELIGSYGFRTTFTVSFEKILPPIIDGAPSTTLPLPTIVPITRGFFDADITVVMPHAGSANHFVAKIYGMGTDIFNLLTPQTTLVRISLGYDDGSSSEVISGVLQKKQLSLPPGEGLYMAELAGVDFVFDKIQNPCTLITYPKPGKAGGAPAPVSKPVGDIVKDICRLAGVPAQVKIAGPQPKSVVFDKVTPLAALQALANRGGCTLQVKDGAVWFGAPADIGTVRLKPITDGGTGDPVAARGANACASPLDGQDFDMAGDPTLRPNDTLVLGTDPYRIQSVTHTLLRTGGYRCVGRALSPAATAADQQTSGRPGAALVARTIRDNVDGREQTRPAVSAGQVADYAAGQHITTLSVGLDATADMTSPTVQAPLRDNPATLPGKPMASPFAFHQCGLVTPVYKKMRALVVNGWHEPNDAVIDGFLWSSDMTPPPNESGDWWLCLPTQFDGDGLPTGPTADDLITAEGQRVISVKGMKITVGAGLLNSAGSRPDPGSDESLTVQSDQGAKITLSGTQIEMTDGEVTVTIGGGMVKIG